MLLPLTPFERFYVRTMLEFAEGLCQNGVLQATCFLIVLIFYARLFFFLFVHFTLMMFMPFVF